MPGYAISAFGCRYKLQSTMYQLNNEFAGLDVRLYSNDPTITALSVTADFTAITVGDVEAQQDDCFNWDVASDSAGIATATSPNVLTWINTGESSLTINGYFCTLHGDDLLFMAESFNDPVVLEVGQSLPIRLVIRDRSAMF